MNSQVLYPGLKDPKTFPGTLEAMEHVYENGKHTNFLIKTSIHGAWEDGAKLFKGFQAMFAPVGS